MIKELEKPKPEIVLRLETVPVRKRSAVLFFGLVATLGVALACMLIYSAMTGNAVWYGRLLLACLIGAYSTSHLANIGHPDPKERRLRAVSSANTKGVLAFLFFAVVKFLFV